MTKQKQYPIQVDYEVKEVLDLYRKKNGIKSYRIAIAHLLGIDTPFFKSRCWEK